MNKLFYWIRLSLGFNYLIYKNNFVYREVSFTLYYYSIKSILCVSQVLLTGNGGTPRYQTS
jgi:hypothetical protein